MNLLFKTPVNLVLSLKQLLKKHNEFLNQDIVLMAIEL